MLAHRTAPDRCKTKLSNGPKSLYILYRGREEKSSSAPQVLHLGSVFFAPLNWPRTSQPSVEVIVHVSRVRAAFLCFREEAGGSIAGGVTVLVSVGCTNDCSDGYGVADRSPDGCYRCAGCVGGAGAWVMPLAASDARPRP